MKILRLFIAAMLLGSIALPLALGGKGLDPRKVSVLYLGDPYPGVTPYLAFELDAFIVADPILCYHHGGGQTQLVDIYKYMRIYMPRNEQEYLESYDAVLFSDAYRRSFTNIQLYWIRDSVSENGVGVAMVAGLDSYGASTSRPAASWELSPIEEVLPVLVPPPEYHHNWIQPYVNPAGARIIFDDYQNEFIASLPFDTDPRYTWAFNGQIVLEKPGSEVLARWVLPGFNNPPCYSTWKQGRGRTFAMLHDWTGSSEFTRWDYYHDFAINLMLYIAQRPLPTDPVLVHEYRANVHQVSIGKSMLLSLIYFVESFGGNARQLDREITALDQMNLEAGEYYLDNDFAAAVAASEATLVKFKEVEELSIKIKNEALFWVYVVEWLSVTGVSMVSGFMVWTLMVRRRLYQDVKVTRLRKSVEE